MNSTRGDFFKKHQGEYSMRNTMMVTGVFMLMLATFVSLPISAADRTVENPQLAKIVTGNLSPWQMLKMGDCASYTINFPLLLNYATLCQLMNYNPDEDLLEVYPNSRFIDLPKLKNRMVIIDDAGFDKDGNGIQTVVFRGSGNPRNFLVDLNFRPSKSKILGCRIHRGFLKSVLEIDAVATPLLDKNRKVRVTGSSLGGGLAAVYAMFLHKQGFEVDLVVTFGQPRVTDQEGRKLFQDLPLFRLFNQSDAIVAIPPCWPFGYAHFGTAIVMYADNRYSIYNQDILKQIKPDSPVANFFHKMSHKDVSIPNHFINLLSDRLQSVMKNGAKYHLWNLGILPEDK
jgi:hypothetical protein